MNIRDLKYLLAVANFKHFGKAAEACNVSQPTLSMQIKKMEELLGVQIFERSNKKVIITPVGTEIIAHATNALNEITLLEQEASAAKDPFTGVLKLGIIPTIAPYLLPKVLGGINNTFQSLSINIYEKQTDILLEMLSAGLIDAAILAFPIEYEHLEVAPLYYEPFLLAVPEEHHFSGRKSLSIIEIENDTVLLLEDGHCLRDHALEACKLSGAKENMNFSATSLETIRQLVASKVGVTLMPKLAQRQNDSLRYIEFSDEPKPGREVGLAWRSSSPKTLLFNKITEIVKERIN